jgi:hypothetical protein
MDVEPPVGDDLNRMLVSMKQEVLQRAAAEPPAKPRPWARRHLGLTLSLVALLGIGGATGALALVLPSSFEATAPASPTSTPEPSATPRATATPTFEPTAPEQDPVPRPAFDVDCGELGDRIGVGQLVEASAPLTWGPEHFDVTDAAYLQAGALTCTWAPEGYPYAEYRVVVTVSPAGDRGREWISGLRESGLASLGEGDVSAAVCPEGTILCNTSTVVGPWWIETTNYARPDTVTGDRESLTPDTVRPVVRALVSELAVTTPPRSWTVPDGAWQIPGCEAMPSPAELSAAVGDVTYGEPRDLLADAPQTGIRTTQLREGACAWQSSAAPGEAQAFSDISVGWLSGGGWAPGTATTPGTPVQVEGADRATVQCYEEEGASCWVDVVVGDSWIRLQASVFTGYSEETALRLVPAAEAIIAAGTRG